MPLDKVPMVATHNSFNSEEEGVSTPWEVSLCDTATALIRTFCLFGPRLP